MKQVYQMSQEQADLLSADLAAIINRLDGDSGLVKNLDGVADRLKNYTDMSLRVSNNVLTLSKNIEAANENHLRTKDEIDSYYKTVRDQIGDDIDKFHDVLNSITPLSLLGKIEKHFESKIESVYKNNIELMIEINSNLQENNEQIKKNKKDYKTLIEKMVERIEKLENKDSSNKYSISTVAASSVIFLGLGAALALAL